MGRPLGGREPAERPAEASAIEVGWREFADESSGVGEVDGRGFAGEPDVFDARPVWVGAFGGV